MKFHHIPDHIIFKHIHPHKPVDIVRKLPLTKATSALNAATTPELGLIVFMDFIFEHKVGPILIYGCAVAARHVASGIVKRTNEASPLHYAAECIIAEVDAHQQEKERDAAMQQKD